MLLKLKKSYDYRQVSKIYLNNFHPIFASYNINIRELDSIHVNNFLFLFNIGLEYVSRNSIIELPLLRETILI